MTKNEALTYLRQRRAYLGDSARAARVVGLESAHIDREAEALSWAINVIECKAAQEATEHHILDKVTGRIVCSYADADRAQRHCDVLNANIASGRYGVVEMLP